MIPSTVKLRDLSLILEQNHVQYDVSVPLYRATHVRTISWENVFKSRYKQYE